MEGNEKSRIPGIDAVKAFAIFCVLWGHAIQQLDNAVVWPVCLLNPVFAFIYAFHMPLFFLLSGFFFKSSIQLNVADFFRKKVTRLILPWLLWCVLLGVYNVAREPRLPALPRLTEIVFFNWFWFLREVCLTHIIVYAFFKLCRKAAIAAPLCVCFALIAPLGRIVGAEQSLYVPVFLVGMLLRERYGFVSQHVNKVLCVSALAFGVCLVFWRGPYYQIVPKLLNPYLRFTLVNLPLGAFRLLTGVTGSLFFITLFQKLYRDNKVGALLSLIGKRTMSLYILQVIVLETFLTNLIDFPRMNSGVYDLLICPLVAVVVLALCMGITALVHRNRLVERVLFGASAQ
jgi:fucose 4-O-acetylase-like acetyltransferase